VRLGAGRKLHDRLGPTCCKVRYPTERMTDQPEIWTGRSPLNATAGTPHFRSQAETSDLGVVGRDPSSGHSPKKEGTVIAKMSPARGTLGANPGSSADCETDFWTHSFCAGCQRDAWGGYEATRRHAADIMPQPKRVAGCPIDFTKEV
jgi:hypothetical protein